MSGAWDVVEGSVWMLVLLVLVLLVLVGDTTLVAGVEWPMVVVSKALSSAIGQILRLKTHLSWDRTASSAKKEWEWSIGQ